MCTGHSNSPSVALKSCLALGKHLFVQIPCVNVYTCSSYFHIDTRLFNVWNEFGARVYTLHLGFAVYGCNERERAHQTRIARALRCALSLCVSAAADTRMCWANKIIFNEQNITHMCCSDEFIANNRTARAAHIASQHTDKICMRQHSIVLSDWLLYTNRYHSNCQLIFADALFT